MRECVWQATNCIIHGVRANAVRCYSIHHVHIFDLIHDAAFDARTALKELAVVYEFQLVRRSQIPEMKRIVGPSSARAD